jgi:hypothetical protein
MAMASIAEANSLFEIDMELDGLLEEIEEQVESEGQASEDVVARFQQFCEAHGEKVDRIGRFVRMMEAREQFCRNESARLADRARAVAGRVERTKSMVLHYLFSRDLKKIAVGRRSPAYCTAIGRVLLGTLTDVEVMHILKRRKPFKFTDSTVTSIPALMRIIERDRKQGWSLVNCEYNDAVCAIAVPVYSHTGQIMAAISAIETPSRADPEKMMKTVLPVLKQTSAKLWN